MVHMPVSAFKNAISDTLNQVAYSGQRILLQRHGKNVVALISMEELKIIEEIERIEDESDIKEALKVLKKIKRGETELVSWEDAKKELNL